ncbi:MAG: GntR family transcriptional regulator [Erysipelotrichaceae bacterium]|nr:GntR family transcriptional regulator [Erysipelotrichaceae bacterium]
MEKHVSKRQIIEDYILNEIGSGRLRAGDQIPAEHELVERFGFGRQTIHNCLRDLAIRGIIERTPGRGSFVSGKPVNRNISNKKSFTEDMRSIGMRPGSRLLEFKLADAREFPFAMKQLELNENEKMYYIVRLRTGDDMPIALQYSYTPYKYIGEIDLSALEGSFDRYIESKGIKTTGFITKLKAIEGNEKQLDLLQAKSKALLKSVSIRYFNGDVPLQCTESLYRSDLFEYTFSSF